MGNFGHDYTLITFGFVILCCIAGVAVSETSTSWSPINTDFSTHRPAGKENENLLYVCKARVNEDVIVGKLWPGPSCNMGYKGGHRYVLHDSPKSTSWIPYNGSVGVANVIGGQLDRKTIFICRTFVYAVSGFLWLIPGYLDYETQTCNVEIGGTHVNSTKEIEVLALNSFGIMTHSDYCVTL